LKVVTAGAGALVSMACSSNGANGFITSPGGGITADASDDGDAHDPCEHTGCGLIDSGHEDHVVVGVSPEPEGGADATEEPPPGLVVNPEGGDEVVGGGFTDGPVGVIINPEAGGD
jgi:hypothetical protein